jgi:hypothetical protein
MMKHAVLFESIITLCRASILICVGKNPFEDRALSFHKVRTLKAVASSLDTEDGTSDAVILSVAMLLTLEYLTGNQSAVGAHRKGLQKMIDFRSDLNEDTPWNIFVKAGLDAYKALGSFVTGELPDMSGDSHTYIRETFASLALDKPIEYPSVPFSPDLCKILSRLPSGLSECCLSAKLSTQTMQVLASINATTISSENPPADDARFDKEIQAMLSALQRLSVMKISKTENYLICGLLAYTFQLRRLRALNLFHDPALRDFIHFIPGQEKPDSVREQHLMIWLSVAVAGALELRTIRIPGTHLVFDRIFKLYPFTLYWKVTEMVLKTFFWTPDILKHWRKSHNRAVSRWNQLTRIQNEKPLVVLSGNDEPEPPQEDIDPLDFEKMMKHVRDTPAAMMHLTGASKCPFQNRMKTLCLPTDIGNPHI